MKQLTVVFYLTFLFYGTAQDSLSTVLPENQGDTLHSPKKAMLYSLVLPGAGQIYNHIAMSKGKKKAFWKVPIIYAGLGITTYFILENNKLKNDARAEHEFRIANNMSNDAQFANFNLSGVLTTYNQSLRNRDLMIFGAIIIYGLNILDAGVEAHFVNFDVTDDLSLQIKPAVLNSNALGMHLSFNFR